MAEYRIYPIGEDGKFLKLQVIYCDNDEVAIKEAKMLSDHAEVWGNRRLVAQISFGRTTKFSREAAA
jgi:hypothetical protein